MLRPAPAALMATLPCGPSRAAEPALVAPRRSRTTAGGNFRAPAFTGPDRHLVVLRPLD